MLRKIVNVSGIIVVLALAIWPFIQIVPERYAATGNSVAWPTVDEPQACLLDKPGYLSVETYGSLVSKLDLKGDKLRCIGKLDALNSRSRVAFFTEPDSAGTYRAEGELYCSSAIAQIQGPGSITISNFLFAGGLATNYSVSAERDTPEQ